MKKKTVYDDTELCYAFKRVDDVVSCALLLMYALERGEQNIHSHHDHHDALSLPQPVTVTPFLFAHISSNAHLKANKPPKNTFAYNLCNCY